MFWTFLSYLPGACSGGYLLLCINPVAVAVVIGFSAQLIVGYLQYKELRRVT